MTPGPHRKNGNKVFPVKRCNSEEIIKVAKSIAQKFCFLYTSRQTNLDVCDMER